MTDNGVATRLCEICCEERPTTEILFLNCNKLCSYCSGCLNEMITMCRDEVNFPPACGCGSIRAADIPSTFAGISPERLSWFRNREMELSVQARDRTYCCNRECEQWVPPFDIDIGKNVARCKKCRTETCTECKQHAHLGTSCPVDHDTAELLQSETCRLCPSCGLFMSLKRAATILVSTDKFLLSLFTDPSFVNR